MEKNQATLSIPNWKEDRATQSSNKEHFHNDMKYRQL